jgi:hypothetical protein
MASSIRLGSRALTTSVIRALTSQASASSEPRRTSTRHSIGFSTVSEGRLHLNPNACWLESSQLEAGSEGAPDRWIRSTTTGRVALLAMIAGTMSYLGERRR